MRPTSPFPREVPLGRLAPPDSQRELTDIVARLRDSREHDHNIRQGGIIRKVPSRVTLAAVAEQLVTALFPIHYGSLDINEASVDGYVAGILAHALGALVEQVRLDLALHTGQSPAAVAERAGEIVQTFAAELPTVRGLLVGDLKAAYESDPAATSYPEVLLAYPGMIALVYHRIAHLLFRLGAALSARLIASFAHSKTSIDIHPGAEIGPEFFIDHGTGVVIGETAIIGRRVRLHQAVTLGARSFLKDEAGVVIKGVPRHPIVEDDVVIYAGATILGRVTIGRGSVIGGNVWVTESVSAGSYVTQAQLRNE